MTGLKKVGCQLRPVKKLGVLGELTNNILSYLNHTLNDVKESLGSGFKHELVVASPPMASRANKISSNEGLCCGSFEMQA